MTNKMNDDRQKVRNDTQLGTDKVSEPKVVEIFGAPFDKNIPRIRMTSIIGDENEVLQADLSAFLGHRIIFELKMKSFAKIVSTVNYFESATCREQI